MHDIKSGTNSTDNGVIPNNGDIVKLKFDLTREQNISISKEHYKNNAENNVKINFSCDVNKGKKSKAGLSATLPLTRARTQED